LRFRRRLLGGEGQLNPSDDLRAYGREIARRSWPWLEDFVSEVLLQRSSADPVRLLRALGEMMGIITAFASSSEAAILGMRSALINWAEDLDWEALVLQDRSYVVALGTVIEFLDACNRSSVGLRRVMKRALQVSNLDAHVTKPYRRLELDVLLWRIGERPSDAGRLSLLLESAWGELDKPLSAYSVRDRYALSHLVFYLCLAPHHLDQTFVSRERLKILRESVRGSLLMALIERNSDLAAEFEICSFLLCQCNESLFRIGFGHHQPSLNRRVRTEALFDDYHPILMWTLAATLHADGHLVR